MPGSGTSVPVVVPLVVELFVELLVELLVEVVDVVEVELVLVVLVLHFL
jgi:hypothetical protein